MPQYPNYQTLRVPNDTPGLIAWWPLDDTTTTQSYSRVLNPGANSTSYIVPRNIVINGTFDTNTVWSVGTGWAITGGQAVATASAAGQAMSQSIPMTIGKAYTITYTITVTAGSIKSQAGTANGTTQTASGTYTDTLICTGNTTLSFTDVTIFTGTLDNVTVTQVNIPAYNSVPTQLLVDGDMEAAGTSAWTAGNSATLSKQTGTPRTGSQVLRVARNGVSSPYAGQTIYTIGNVERAYGYVRSDGTALPSVSNGTTVLFTGTNSTTWQSYDVIFVAVATDLRLGTSTNTGTQYVEYDDCTSALNTALRPDQVLQDNDMEQSGTGYWIAANSATLSKQTTTPHGGMQCLRVAYNGVSNPYTYQSVPVIGKTYRASGWGRGDGVFAFEVGNTQQTTLFSGTSSNTWQFFDVIFVTQPSTNGPVFKSLSTSAGYAEFDDITVYEIDPLSGLPLNGVVLGATTGANGHLNTCYSFDGVNDVVNIYSADLNSVFNPSEGTLMVWFKVSGVGIWTNALAGNIIELGNSGVNQIILWKASTNNSLLYEYRAGGTTITNTIAVNPSTQWMMMAITWSKSNNQTINYLNGLQLGSIRTGLGVWNVNLPSTGCLIGANSIAGTNSPFSGFINDPRLYNRALSHVEIYNEYNKNFPIYRDR